MSSLSDRLRRLAARAEVGRMVKLRPPGPLASITFDDFPRSAWEAGGPILARHGVKATYYAAGRYCGAIEDGQDYYDPDTLRAVHGAGHEIGCHSFGHDNGPRVDDVTLAADAAENAAFVRRTLDADVRLVSYAYPYGELSARTKRLMGPRFATARGVQGGINAGWTDLAALRGEPLEARSWSAAGIEAVVGETVRRNGWLVLFSHDVGDDPSPYGCAPAMLEHALTVLNAAGVEVLPVKHALARATFG